MVYGCDGCACTLSAGATACPRCGEMFDEAVPLDAVLPKSGFHTLAPAEAEIAALRGQAIALQSDVTALRDHILMLTSQIAALESHSATLANRLTVLEMAGREDKRRFMDHVQHVKEALGSIQINGSTSAAGQ